MRLHGLVKSPFYLKLTLNYNLITPRFILAVIYKLVPEFTRKLWDEWNLV